MLIDSLLSQNKKWCWHNNSYINSFYDFLSLVSPISVLMVATQSSYVSLRRLISFLFGFLFLGFSIDNPVYIVECFNNKYYMCMLLLNSIHFSMICSKWSYNMFDCPYPMFVSRKLGIHVLVYSICSVVNEYYFNSDLIREDNCYHSFFEHI